MKLCPKCHKQFSDDANFCPVDAARLAPLESQSVATDPIAAKFELGDRLGGARTGSVYRAVDKATGQPAAVKIIAPAVVALPSVGQRLERELKQLERVQSAGVAKVLGSGRRGDDTWVATELLDGAQTLAESIAARGPIPLDIAAHLIEVIGEALIEAAQVGVVHRDLAPKNVLFAGDDIKLINFSLPVPGDKAAGVSEFVAPEQQDGKPVDQRSNLFSLGALYYYVLTGTPVQHEDSGAVKPPSTFAPVSAAVDALIVRSLDRSPTKRFLTVRQFVDEVSRIARGEATQALGRPGKPKAELVQTLLGVRGGGLTSAIAAVAPPPGVQLPASLLGPDAPALPGAQTIPEPPPTIPEPPYAEAPHAQTLVDPEPPSHELAAQPGRGAPSTFAGVAAPQIHTTPAPGVPLQPAVIVPSAPLQPAVIVPTAPHSTTLIGPAVTEPDAAVAAAPQQVPPPERSPWAQPATVEPEPRQPASITEPQSVPAVLAAAPASAATVPAAPSPASNGASTATVPAAPVVPAPLLAAPVLPKNTAKPNGGESKGKFRETMWFKKGDLDVQAAEAAAAEAAKTGKVGQDKADSLPIDERYKDDGTLSRSDKEKYSLRTGATQMMAAARDSGVHAPVGKVSEDALIDEMKSGRTKIFALIGVGLIILILLIVLLAR